jgi:LmbE family N-acetylglucosaminyl deacetylase
MLRFAPKVEAGSRCTVLCFGAHCDDIEIGCGGTLLRLLAGEGSGSAAGNPPLRGRAGSTEVTCYWVVASSNPQREVECRRSAELFLAGASRSEVITWQFRDGYLPYVAVEVKDAFERLKREISPDLIFTHYRDDLHQDHRLMNSLTWNTFRDHVILEYEIPKYDGDFSSPNLYVPISDAHATRKSELLMQCYESQLSHRWFTPETFRSVLRIRGVEVGSPTGYAEGFYARKVMW